MITLLLTAWLITSTPDKYIFPGYAPIPAPEEQDRPTRLPNEPAESAINKPIIKMA